jgi:hypothetical protein
MGMVNCQQMIKDTVIVKKRIGDSYAVWFEPSRSFVLFEMPAYEVFSLYSEGKGVNEIINDFKDKYGLNLSEGKKFVEDIIERTEAYCNPDNAPYKSPELVNDFKNITFEIFSENHYHIGDKSITFHYGTDWLMNCFHPFIVHLEETTLSTRDFLFEVFEHSGLLVVRCNGEIVEVFRPKDLNYLRGCVWQKLYGVLYDLNEEDWMITLHASGISNGKSSIIFPAQAGSGKSTLAALLQSNNFTIISDDFITIDRKFGFSYRLPAAISIKEGSVKILSQYYPELNDIVSQKASTAKIVRYLPLKNNLDGTENKFPVKAFVFVNYSPDEPFTISKVGKKEALKALLAETWVNPDPENVVEFFNWIDDKEFYRLKYSDNVDAVQCISKLFSS